ncbi:MAG: hypothetical protein LBP21_05980, partial [Synergistaceae bacterium]|nr:hypothetical protein [Synergistaceae bacterium]
MKQPPCILFLVLYALLSIFFTLNMEETLGNILQIYFKKAMGSIMPVCSRDAVIFPEISVLLSKKGRFGRVGMGISEPFGILDRSLVLSTLSCFLSE